jgi:hypothetical protein
METDQAAELARLRRMVQTLGDILVECGVVDPAIVEGRLRAASLDPDGAAEMPSLKRPGLFARLFHRASQEQSVPMAPIPVDQTTRVALLPFEAQSLYDEPIGSTNRRSPFARRATPASSRASSAPHAGTCARCWRRAPVDGGNLCARCAVLNG